MSSRRILIALMALSFSFVGCGKGADDPLSGTWSNALCFGDTEQPADIQACTTKLDFNTDLTLTVTDARQSLPATAVDPRCTTTRVMKGLKYSTDSQGTVTFTGTTTATLVRKDCANTADNQSEISDTRDSVPSGTSSYSIANRTLSLTSGPLIGEYQRAAL